MRKALWSVILAVVGGIASYVTLVFVGIIDPDLVNPYQEVMILKQAAEGTVLHLRPIPPAPDHIRVLVTYLEGDPEGVATNRLYASIRREPVFETILLYRPLHIPKTGTYQEAQTKTDQAAAELTKIYGADVVVYGQRDISSGVLDVSVYSAGRANSTPLAPYSFDHETLRLPENLVAPLADAIDAKILRSSNRAGVASLSAKKSIANRLLVALAQSRTGLDESLRASLNENLGWLCVSIHDETNDASWSDRALNAFRSAESWTRTHSSLRYYRDELAIGEDLLIRAETNRDSSELRRSIASLQVAAFGFSQLQRRTEVSVAQYELSNSLNALGDMNNDISSYRNSSAMLQSALKLPGINKSMKANMLLQLGDIRSKISKSIDVGTSDSKTQSSESLSLLEQAASAYRESIELFHSTNMSREAILAEGSLGDAIESIYAKNGDFSKLPEAIEFYRDLVSLYGNNQAAESADARYNLASALADFGQQTSNLGLIREAIAHYESARLIYLKLKLTKDAQDAQSAIADEKKCLDNIALWLEKVSQKQPVCRLWSSRRRIDGKGDVVLYWDSSNATSGTIEPEVGQVLFASGNVRIYGISETTVFTATFENAGSSRQVNCSTTVIVMS